jgi:hypothetical protein
VKKAAFFIEKDDFERLELLSELSRCNIGVDVENLAICALG